MNNSLCVSRYSSIIFCISQNIYKKIIRRRCLDPSVLCRNACQRIRKNRHSQKSLPVPDLLHINSDSAYCSAYFPSKYQQSTPTVIFHFIQLPAVLAMFIQDSFHLIDKVVESHIVIVDILHPVFVFLSAHNYDICKNLYLNCAAQNLVKFRLYRCCKTNKTSV